jgi:hypothetical protein
MTSSDTTATDSSSSSTPVSPDPQQVKAPPLRVRQPMFRSPRATPSTSPSADGSETSSVADPIDTESGPTRSSDSGAAVQVDKTALAEIARKFVLTASFYVHNLLARTAEEEEADLWIATSRDQAQIGDPIAKIGVRHGGPDGASADTADLIAAGLGLAAYIARNAAKAWEMRRARKKLLRATAPALNHETGEPA